VNRDHSARAAEGELGAERDIGRRCPLQGTQLPPKGLEDASLFRTPGRPGLTGEVNWDDVVLEPGRPSVEPPNLTRRAPDCLTSGDAPSELFQGHLGFGRHAVQP
jgi:hypothetical protein